MTAELNLLDAPKNAPAHMAALHKWNDFPSHFSRPPPQGAADSTRRGELIPLRTGLWAAAPQSHT